MDCSARAQAALHVRSAGYSDLDPGNALSVSHSHRHFPEHQHPCSEHHLDLQRARTAGHGESNHHSSGAQPNDHRE